jgi:hypothetical protein
MSSPTALGANTLSSIHRPLATAPELPGSFLNPLAGMEINHVGPNRAPTNVARRPHAAGRSRQPPGSVSWRRIGRRPRKSPKIWTRWTASQDRERRVSRNKNLVTKNFVASVKCSLATQATFRRTTPSRHDPHAHVRTKGEGTPAFYRAQILTAESKAGDSAAGDGRASACGRLPTVQPLSDISGLPRTCTRRTGDMPLRKGNAGRCVASLGLQSRPQAIDS